MSLGVCFKVPKAHAGEPSLSLSVSSLCVRDRFSVTAPVPCVLLAAMTMDSLSETVNKSPIK